MFLINSISLRLKIANCDFETHFCNVLKTCLEIDYNWSLKKIEGKSFWLQIMETDNLLYGSNLVLRPNRLWTVTLCLSIKFTIAFHSAIVRRHNPWSFYLQCSATLSLYIFLWYHVHRINSYMWSVLCVCTLWMYIRSKNFYVQCDMQGWRNRGAGRPPPRFWQIC